MKYMWHERVIVENAIVKLSEHIGTRQQDVKGIRG